MVKKCDMDTFDALGPPLDAANLDLYWHLPPMRTKTWFHLGAHHDNDFISQEMAAEYFGVSSTTAGGAKEVLREVLDLGTFPSSLDASQLREPDCALKGHTLRTEIYADDGSPKTAILYTVQKSNYTVDSIQSDQDSHLQGIYFVHFRENISVQFRTGGQ